MVLKKVDRRMNGYGRFILMADYAYIKEGDRNFALARQWCTESFGPTVELEIWSKYTDLQNPKWSWERGDFNKSHRCRIYLADQQTANWFSLKFGSA